MTEIDENSPMTDPTQNTDILRGSKFGKNVQGVKYFLLPTLE